MSPTSYEVVTQFAINRAGEVVNLRVISSSGDLRADAAAFAAISSLSTLFERPIGCEDEEIHINKFVFQYEGRQPRPEIQQAWQIARG
jgi:TonB family protein